MSSMTFWESLFGCNRHSCLSYKLLPVGPDDTRKSRHTKDVLHFINERLLYAIRYGPAFLQSDWIIAGPYLLFINRMRGRTVKYQARGFEVRTELARSVRKNEGLVFHGTARAIRLINSLLHGKKRKYSEQ